MSNRDLLQPPPVNVDAERMVLAKILLAHDNAPEAMEILDSVEHPFSDSRHAVLYQAVKAVKAKGINADLQNVGQHLLLSESDGIAGGIVYVAELASESHISAGADYHAKAVRDAAVLRNVQAIAYEVTMSPLHKCEDPEQYIESLLSRMFAAITPYHGSREVCHILEPMQRVLEEAEAMRTGRPVGRTFPTQWPCIDRMIGGGLEGGKMYIIAARTSVGKTAFALNLAANIAVSKTPALVFSLEMSREELLKRTASIVCGVNWQAMLDGFQPANELTKLATAMRELDGVPLYVDDKSAQTITSIATRAKRHTQKRGPGVIVVDYLQLIAETGKSRQRYEALGEISRGLKQLARDLDVPVVALAQLNREAEAETDGFRMMRYLRESGSIEQDADTIMILTKANKEHVESMREHYSQEDIDNALVATVAKNRSGRIGLCYMKFEKQIQRICDMGAQVADAAPQATEMDFEELV